MIRQGEIYWFDLGTPSGSGPGLRHPHLVVQNDVFNASALSTTVVCTLTSNLSRARAPGNVLVPDGEAGLPRASVVVVSQLFTVDKDELVERIGKLDDAQLRKVIDGISRLVEPRELAER